jgi:hypothetical protein
VREVVQRLNMARGVAEGAFEREQVERSLERDRVEWGVLEGREICGQEHDEPGPGRRKGQGRDRQGPQGSKWGAYAAAASGRVAAEKINATVSDDCADVDSDGDGGFVTVLPETIVKPGVRMPRIAAVARARRRGAGGRGNERGRYIEKSDQGRGDAVSTEPDTDNYLQNMRTVTFPEVPRATAQHIPPKRSRWGENVVFPSAKLTKRAIGDNGGDGGFTLAPEGDEFVEEELF